MLHLEDDYNDIIQKAREGRGLSIRKLSDIIKASPKEVIAIEAGEKELTEQFAQTLGLSYSKAHAIYEHRYMPQEHPEKISEGLILKRFEVNVGSIISNAYVLLHGHYGLLVDSVGASPPALSFVEEEGCEPRFLLITHGHFDHISGVQLITGKYPKLTVLYAGRDIKSDTRFETDGFTIQVFQTPGHTEDSVCFLVNNIVMFTGDTIFAGSVGRPNYSYDALLKNIREKIFTLRDEVILAPGHGPLTTVGEEKEHNPFF